MNCPRNSSEQSQAETTAGAVMTVLFAFTALAKRNVQYITHVGIIAVSIQNNIRVIPLFRQIVII